MPDETLTIKITGDSKEYEKSVRDAEKTTKGFSGTISDIGSKTAGGLASGLKITAGVIAGVSAALGAGVVAGVKYNASIEQYETSFETMTGSAEKAADIVARLNKIGAETPFEFTDLADTTNMLMQFGFTADEAIDSMQMLGDISQGSADKMGSISRAYAKMRSSQKVTLEDINMMIDAGFNPLQEISDQTGESMQSLYDRISAGSMSVDEVTAAMQRATSEGGKYYQSMEKQSQTINGMISTLKDNAQQLLGQVIQPISESFGTKLLPAAINSIEQLTIAFQTQGVEGLIQAGGQILTNLLLGISMELPNLITTALQIIQSFIANLSSNLPQIVTAGGQILTALGNGILQLLPTLGTLALNLVTTLYSSISANAPAMLQGGYDLLNKIVSGFVQAIPEALPKALDFIQQLGENIAAAAPEMIQKGADLLSQLVDGIISALPILISRVPEIISTFANIINDNFPVILAKGAELLTQFVKGIIDTIPTLVANIPKIVTAIVDVIQAYNWLGLGKNIITFFKNGITSAAGAVKTAVTNIKNNITSTLKTLPSTILSIGKSLVSKLASGISSGVKNVVSKVKGIITNIKSAFTDIDWGSVGSNIISGIGNGIKNAAGNLAQSAINAASNALNGVKNFLGISSPSKVFRDEVGLFMAQGMGVGFINNIPIDEIKTSLNSAVYDLSDYYSQIGQRINPVDAITGTASISQSYMADISNIFEGMVIQIDNVTNLDGKPIYEKSAQYTIQKIGNQQRAVRRARGAVA